MKITKKDKLTEKLKIDTTDTLKQAPPSPTKDLVIDSTTGVGEKVLKKYLPIIEMVVKKEYKSIPSYLAEYSELVNIGLIAVNKLLEEAANKKRTYNSSYIAQAVKWAIKDELRVKYGWYGVKQSQQKEIEGEGYGYVNDITLEGEVDESAIKHEAQERIFEAILYLDDLTFEAVSGEQSTSDELARLELKELQQAVKRAIAKLPEKHKMVMELRFYEGKKGNDVALELGVTPSRVSHMIQDAIEKVKQSLTQEGFY